MITHAYIDAANLHSTIKELKWDFDYKRFYIWLKDKYKIQNAYLFIGFIPSRTALYDSLHDAGYILIHKEVTYDQTGKAKGNCDAELVLKMVSDYYEHSFTKAIIISSDGDYACLVKFLKERKAFEALISPSQKCSYLLKKLNVPILYLETQKHKLENASKRKSPR